MRFPTSCSSHRSPRNSESAFCWDCWRYMLQQARFLENKKLCFRQRNCPDKLLLAKKNTFLRKSSAPGSATAPDKLLLQTRNPEFLEINLPHAAKLPDKWFLPTKKVGILGKVLPQAAQLPQTSGLIKGSPIYENKISPRQRSCPESGLFKKI